MPGHLYTALFPPQIIAITSAIAQIVLVLFLFSVGYELDLGTLRAHPRAVPLTAALAFGLPMTLGTLAAFGCAPLLDPHAGPGTSTRAFVLFIAVSVSITAVPVLAGILRERGMDRQLVGVVAMAAASLIDAAGWLGLSVALLLARGTEGGSLVRTAVLFTAYILVMTLAVRPALRWWLRSAVSPRSSVPVVFAVIALASASVTSELGLQVIFGAFLAGVICPRGEDGTSDTAAVVPMREAGRLLLPLFFAISGLAVDLTRPSPADLTLLALLLSVAVVGKIVGGTIGARLGGLDSRTGLLVGILLNTRGLTELIVLNAGLQAHLVDQRLYTILVIVAVVTTMATGPLCAALSRVPRTAGFQTEHG